MTRREPLSRRAFLAAAAAATGALAAPARADTTAVSDADGLLDALRDGRKVVSLRPGNYGKVELRDLPGDARIVSEQPGRAVFETVAIARTSRLDFEDIAVIPTERLGRVKRAIIFSAAANTDRIRLIRPIVRGAPQAESCEGWSVEEWKSRQASAVTLQGPLSAVIGGDFYAIAYHAVSLTGDDGLIEGNTFQWIAGDTMRGLGDRTQVRNNRMRNRVRPINPGEEKTDTHADFFQSWARKDDTGTLKPVTGLLVEGNLGIQWAAGDHPLAGYMQGMGLFDGPFVNPVIRRNEIWTTSGHGVAISRSTGALVEDNLIANLAGSTEKPVPWIRLDEARDATVRGNTVAMVVMNGERRDVTKLSYARLRPSAFETWPLG